MMGAVPRGQRRGGSTAWQAHPALPHRLQTCQCQGAGPCFHGAGPLTPLPKAKHRAHGSGGWLRVPPMWYHLCCFRHSADPNTATAVAASSPADAHYQSVYPPLLPLQPLSPTPALAAGACTAGISVTLAALPAPANPSLPARRLSKCPTSEQDNVLQLDVFWLARGTARHSSVPPSACQHMVQQCSPQVHASTATSSAALRPCREDAANHVARLYRAVDHAVDSRQAKGSCTGSRGHPCPSSAGRAAPCCTIMATLRGP